MSTERVPELLIEQYLLGELSPEAAARVERSIGFEERVEMIRRDNDSFARRYPAGVYAARIRNQYDAGARTQKHARRRARVVRVLTLALPGAAAMLAIGILLFGGRGDGFVASGDPQAEITRLKGAQPGISLYRADPTVDGGVQRLSDGERARPGDVVQLAYQAAGASYGMVFSIDGSGAVTLHYPPSPASSPALTPGGEQPLPYAYRLDDAPRFETFYFITSESPFDVSTLLADLHGQAAHIAGDPDRSPDLPRHFEIRTITIRKGE